MPLDETYKGSCVQRLDKLINKCILLILIYLDILINISDSVILDLTVQEIRMIKTKRIKPTHKQIRELCVILNSRNDVETDKEIAKLVGSQSREQTFEMFLDFARNNQQYTKILARVINKFRPIVHCVYILKNNESVVYVGKSDNLCDRLSTHAKDKDFNSVLIIQLQDAKSQSLCENSLILKYKPKYNSALNIKDSNMIIDFENTAVDFKLWLDSQKVFTRVSMELQEKLGCSMSAKGYVQFHDSSMSLLVKDDPSAVLVWSETIKSLNTMPPESVRGRLKSAAEDCGDKSLFKDVGGATYKFGKFYITDYGRWRIEGTTTWYRNADLDSLIKQVTENHKPVTVQERTDPVPIWFGKYKGKFFSEVKVDDPSYCNWILGKFTKNELSLLGAL